MGRKVLNPMIMVNEQKLLFLLIYIKLSSCEVQHLTILEEIRWKFQNNNYLVLV